MSFVARFFSKEDKDGVEVTTLQLDSPQQQGQSCECDDEDYMTLADAYMADTVEDKRHAAQRLLRLQMREANQVQAKCLKAGR
ncbi:hypothetical protein MCOR27_006336 [Pyricularia oryzae]|uniref:Uncharacterized protein n=2 Tax=Pyricularia TaxID=48558 RepID=A0ABQ8P041_PYRGI|nr:hypothetical protein MCOR01_007593 [Pyricularia oryzae]KAI6304620.1 hypothetical protein MCOR33_000470 [Pyricularia grisea]KAH9433767.1 hypothetical protein MCOR02_005808 [Pyricularia oryzae]KAI6260186.1 hypothetical protein MCOR19_003501 [Pyricularia oryzae]KAI6276729.1 hypothetical protein MCOR27_006336 [Pyricularia oryzae]